jgi:hypothetical protein
VVTASFPGNAIAGSLGIATLYGPFGCGTIRI